jgi:O-antigen/teichoic acid export membrane protein
MSEIITDKTHKKSTDNKRIAKNTILLYTRMIIVMIINLYAVRLIIKDLGMEDYGIYNVIAGVVTSLSCLTGVLAASTQRFYSIAQGREDNNKLQLIFSTSIRINIIIVVALLLIAETVGLWFINNQLVIPENRIIAANWVYQTALISFAFVFLQTPFSAAVIAHENMGIFAVISLLECILKFGAAFILLFITVDNLIWYSLLLSIASVIVFLLYVCVCKKKYQECRYTSSSSNELLKEMISFSGWTLLTSCASICMYQANTILVNIYFGQLVNASRGIALQLNAALSSFTASFLMAVRPPIMKLYAEGKYSDLNTLFNLSNKFIFYLMLLICIPLFFEMDTILKIWLNQNDSQSVLFSKLIVIYNFILALNNPISYIIQATGQVKKYCLYVEVFTIACMPLTYLFFSIGFEAVSTFWAMIICVTLSHVARIVCLQYFYHKFSLSDYCVNFLLRGIIVAILSIAATYYVQHFLLASISRIIITALVSSFSTIMLMYIIGLSANEKLKIKEEMSKIIAAVK